MDIETQIKKAILNKIFDAQIILESQDDSHFSAIVISKEFIGKSLVTQQQMVMSSLKELFNSSLHAFSLKTFTPEKWEQNQCKTQTFKMS